MSSDPILSLSDDELRDRYPTVDPDDIRRLRAAFLAKNEKEVQDLSDEIRYFKKENGL